MMAHTKHHLGLGKKLVLHFSTGLNVQTVTQLASVKYWAHMLVGILYTLLPHKFIFH